MNFKTLLLIFVASASLAANNTFFNPYNGGDQFKHLYTNANLLNGLLSKVSAGSAIVDACAEIKGVGVPILSVKKAIQDIDESLDATYPHTYAKVIFFKEVPKPSNFQTLYKIVVQVRTFHTTNYLAVSGLYKQLGSPTFEVTSYLFDSDISNVRTVLEESTVVETGYFGCGDVKSIYSQFNPVNPSPQTSPYAPGDKIVNAAPEPASAPNAALIAEIVKLLSSGN